MLIENSTHLNDSSACSRTLGGDLTFDGGDPLMKARREFLVRQLSQPTRNAAGDFGRVRRFTGTRIQECRHR